MEEMMGSYCQGGKTLTQNCTGTSLHVITLRHQGSSKSPPALQYNQSHASIYLIICFHVAGSIVRIVFPTSLTKHGMDVWLFILNAFAVVLGSTAECGVGQP